jgi:hypothetical protein
VFVNAFLTHFAGHLITPLNSSALCCPHANEHHSPAHARSHGPANIADQPGGNLMSDLFFIVLTVAFFFAAAAFAWFCQKVR